LQNSLVRGIYLRRESIKEIDEFIKEILESQQFDIKSLTSEFSTKDKKFDDKMYDIFAVLYALQRFIKKGAQNIELVTKEKDKKTPDLRMSLDGRETFVEVKNINNLVNDSFIMIHDDLEAKSITEPQFYEKWFDISAHAASKLYLLPIPADSLLQFLRKLDREIRRGKNQIAFDVGRIHFIVELRNSDRFIMTLMKESGQFKESIMDESNEFLHYGNIYYKIVKKSHEAFLQLWAARDGDGDAIKNDYIYLHFTGLGEGHIFWGDSFPKRFHELLDAFRLRNLVNIETSLPV
jgi:hypothetical protein